MDTVGTASEPDAASVPASLASCSLTTDCPAACPLACSPTRTGLSFSRPPTVFLSFCQSAAACACPQSTVCPHASPGVYFLSRPCHSFLPLQKFFLVFCCQSAACLSAGRSTVCPPAAPPLSSVCRLPSTCPPPAAAQTRHPFRISVKIQEDARIRQTGPHVPSKPAFTTPTVPLWVSKEGVCCSPHRGEGCPPLGRDSKHGWFSHRTASRRSHRWEIPPRQRPSAAEVVCRRFQRQSYGRESSSSKQRITSAVRLIQTEQSPGKNFFLEKVEILHVLFPFHKVGALLWSHSHERDGRETEELTARLRRRNLKGIEATSVIKHHENSSHGYANLHLTCSILITWLRIGGTGCHLHLCTHAPRSSCQHFGNDQPFPVQTKTKGDLERYLSVWLCCRLPRQKEMQE